MTTEEEQKMAAEKKAKEEELRRIELIKQSDEYKQYEKLREKFFGL